MVVNKREENRENLANRTMQTNEHKLYCYNTVVYVQRDKWKDLKPVKCKADLLERHHTRFILHDGESDFRSKCE